MKKLTLALATLLCATMTFTSCSDDDNTFALLGGWQCTEISGNAGGFDLSQYLSTSSSETTSKYTKLFSIYFVGGTSGQYFRVGDESTFSSIGSAVSSLTGSTSNSSAWSNFLKAGSYTASGSTLTLTPKSGDVETYTYSISDGVLTLASSGTDVSGGNQTVSSVTSVINSILTSVGQSEISTTVGITYKYTKMSVTNLINLFTKSSSAE